MTSETIRMIQPKVLLPLARHLEQGRGPVPWKGPWPWQIGLAADMWLLMGGKADE